jgi:nucleoside-diphosphate-sugar epimerase
LCACRPPRIVTESALVEAVSPYAATKLMIERELDDVAAAGLARTVLRYFNPVGADPQLHAGRTDPDSPDMLSALLAAAAAGRPFVVNGTDCDAVGCRADITRAAELLGRRPITGLDDAVRDALRWVATLPPPTGMTA